MSGFNPGLGFLPVETGRDRARRPPPRVSIPVWVFSLSRPTRPRGCRPHGSVSIPVWVFSLSRQQKRRFRVGDPQLFQSRSGFSPCRDSVKNGGAMTRPAVFQSRSGFSPCRDVANELLAVYEGVFQSRSGFSPCRDYSAVHYRPLLTAVSIPVWVFSLSRRDQSVVLELAEGFNPGLGFLPVETFRLVLLLAYLFRFQSRSGFSPCRDRTSTRLQRFTRCVSIPVWVFSLSRPGAGRDLSDRYGMFQSRSGFSPCRDGQSKSTVI